jgi:hypothetical protein
MAGADPGGCGNAPPGPRTVSDMPWGTPEAASVRRGKSSAGSPLRPKPGSASCEGDRTPPDEPIRIYAGRARRSRHAGRPSTANGGSSIAPSPTACGKPATGLRLHPFAAKPMAQRSHHQRDRAAVTKSSSDGSKHRPCCHRRTPRPCCSGRCSPPARLTCAR